MSVDAVPMAPSVRDRRSAETAELLTTLTARAAIALHGTPVLLLDPQRIRDQYRRLRRALPFVRFHYAVKALSHDAVIDALAEEGCSFDVATDEELRLLTCKGIAVERTIHTHPIKKPTEIASAIAAGVRTFVVDNETELDKFADAPAEVRVLIRLAYRNPLAKSDLSSKFGADHCEATRLVERAVLRGVRVAGFSFHVGSQLGDPSRFVVALTETLDLMDRLQETLPVRFDTLDIGGGFPVAYDADVPPLEEFAAALRPLLEQRAGDLDIIAEPGRILVAEAMTLVTSVVGVSERADGRWYYLDDGVYGSYSNVVAEDVHPFVFAEKDLRTHAHGTHRGMDAATHRWTTLAGPTCDSADVIARKAMLPDLDVGDLLASPVMGAYTAVTATRFNGRAMTPIAVVTANAPLDGAVEPVARVAESRHDVALLVEALVE